MLNVGIFQKIRYTFFDDNFTLQLNSNFYKKYSLITIAIGNIRTSIIDPKKSKNFERISLKTIGFRLSFQMVSLAPSFGKIFESSAIKVTSISGILPSTYNLLPRQELDNVNFNQVNEFLRQFEDEISAIWVVSRGINKNPNSQIQHWAIKLQSNNDLFTIDFLEHKNKGAIQLDHIRILNTSNLDDFFYYLKKINDNKVLKYKWDIISSCTPSPLSNKYNYDYYKNFIDNFEVKLINHINKNSNKYKHKKNGLKNMNKINIGNKKIDDICDFIDEWSNINRGYDVVNSNCQKFVYDLYYFLVGIFYPAKIKQLGSKLQTKPNIEHHKIQYSKLKIIKSKRHNINESKDDSKNDDNNVLNGDEVISSPKTFKKKSEPTIVKPIVLNAENCDDIKLDNNDNKDDISSVYNGNNIDVSNNNHSISQSNTYSMAERLQHDIHKSIKIQNNNNNNNSNDGISKNGWDILIDSVIENNKNNDDVIEILNTFLTICNNLFKNEDKYRLFWVDNPFLKQRVINKVGGMDFLNKIGFKQQKTQLIAKNIDEDNINECIKVINKHIKKLHGINTENNVYIE